MSIEIGRLKKIRSLFWGKKEVEKNLRKFKLKNFLKNWKKFFQKEKLRSTSMYSMNMVAFKSQEAGQLSI